MENLHIRVRITPFQSSFAFVSTQDSRLNFLHLFKIYFLPLLLQLDTNDCKFYGR
jgi:hypothetical protein